MNRLPIAPPVQIPNKNGFRATPPPPVYDPATYATAQPRYVYTNGAIPQGTVPSYNGQVVFVSEMTRRNFFFHSISRSSILYTQPFQQQFYQPLMQPWPTQPPPGQSYYELGNVFSANGLTPQVAFASKPQARFTNHRTIRNKRIMNHDHRQTIDQHQMQNQTMNNHRTLHGTPGNLSHHSNPTQQQQQQSQQLITSQHVNNSSQQQQSVPANAAMYKSQSILSHGSSSKSSDAYHSNKMPKDSSSYPVSSNVPQNISHSHHHPHPPQHQQHYHQHHHPHTHPHAHPHPQSASAGNK